MRGLINPMLVEGQLEGSVVGGMGQALYDAIGVDFMELPLTPRRSLAH